MKLDQLKNFIESVHFVRAFEERIAALADAGDVPGLVHLSLGAELFEAALMEALDLSQDCIFGSHRSHGLALLGGLDARKVAAEILGRETGLSGGVGGTQHLIGSAPGFVASNGIVGAQVPLAAGAALSAKLTQSGGIGVAVFGDGAANQGGVFETMNLAVVQKLPLLFVVENNGLAQSTLSSEATGAASITARARGFAMAAETTDGVDLRTCMPVIERMVTYVRDNSAPAMLEVSVPRLTGHYHGDSEVYRTSDGGDDPLTGLADLAENAGMEKVDINLLVAAGRTRADTAIDQALADKPAGAAS